MNFLNVDIPVKNVPELDKGFVPLGLFFKNYQKGAAKPLCIAVERSGGQIGTYETKIYGTPEMDNIFRMNKPIEIIYIFKNDPGIL